MEVDGWTMMFYDKFAGDHSYNNNVTIGVSLQDLFASDYEQLYNEEAIKVFNKFGGTALMPTNLDPNLYNVILFSTNNSKDNKKAFYTVVGVNSKLLKSYVTKKNQIPNETFLRDLFKFHLCYSRAAQSGGKFGTNQETNIVKKNVDEIVDTAIKKVGDVVDEMIESPPFLTCTLYDYQKRSIKWMLYREKQEKAVSFNLNDEICIGDMFYDVMRQQIIQGDDRKRLTFRGGALIDEVGLGKTIQISTLSILNPATNTSYTRPGCKRLYSRATLVMCPNQLCGQWTRELQDKVKADYGLTVIPILTKVHFDKYTYQDLLDADFVIVSYSFLDNRNFLTPWLGKISTNKSYHKIKPSDFKADKVIDELNKQGEELVKNPSSLSNKNAILPLIYWHRIIMDEFHELYTVAKYSYMINLLPLFQGRYKWCLTGTPFDKGSSCLYKMVDFVTGFTNTYSDRIFSNQSIKNHMTTNFFRRNTKKSITEEYKLPPIKDKIVWLKFMPTERMMYNAYLANPNNDKYSIFLRQLCCHPKLAEETKDALSNCKTLADIEKMMIKHNETNMKNAEAKLNYVKKRLVKTEKKTKKYERKRQKRFLKKLGYKVSIEKLPDDEVDDDDKGLVIDGLDGIDQFNDDNVKDDDSDSESDDDDSKEHIIVNDDNQAKIMKIIGNSWNQNRITLDTLYEAIKKIKDKIKELTKEYEGKKTTYDFFNNVLERIKKTAEREKKQKENDDDDDDVMNDDETCGICLGEIPEEDIGVTKCGHMFCYQCIKVIIAQRHECPYCRKSVKENELYMISYERKKKDVVPTKELKDKIALINEVGTKLANLIYYLKQNDNHTIIFSQWDDLLHKVGAILSDHGIKNTFCRGNVWQRDKAIRTFNTEKDVRVIMLSSESAASGTNLTKAKQVILLDPVYGSYEHRRNTEWQAIGRAHRMGQTKEVEVVRFIIKDTIEEEIFKMNQEEDKKHKVDIKVFETSDDSITLTDDKVKEIAASVNDAKKKKDEKAKTTVNKKIAVKGKKITPKIVDEVEDEEIE
jgi:SNF2 family DNA or RNA helicase